MAASHNDNQTIVLGTRANTINTNVTCPGYILSGIVPHVRKRHKRHTPNQRESNLLGT